MTWRNRGGRIRAGVVQLNSTADVERNLIAVEAAVRGAASEGASLVVVPECFAYLGPEAGKLDLAEPLPEGGPILERCQRLAESAGVDLILGGFWEQGASPLRVRNACIHLNSAGAVEAVYRKIHLFDVDLPDGTRIEESATVEPGVEPVVTQTPLGVLGLSVCYDLRFPGLYQTLADRGATVLAVPSAFTRTTGQDHWHVLLRARAIETQCYVLAAAQTGHHFADRWSYGHALICDPWGTVVAQCSEGVGWVTAALDPEGLQRVRQSLPSLRHRRSW